MQQRLDQQVHGQLTGQQTLPVIECDFAGHAALHISQIALRQLKGGFQHVHQWKNDQIGQQNDGDQNNNIVRIRHDRSDLVFQPAGFGVVLLTCFHCLQAPLSFLRIKAHRLHQFMQTFSASYAYIIIFSVKLQGRNRNFHRCVNRKQIFCVICIISYFLHLCYNKVHKYAISIIFLLKQNIFVRLIFADAHLGDFRANREFLSGSGVRR